jgi:hypothetical protein
LGARPKLFCFVKICIPSYAFDTLLCWNWLFSSPDCKIVLKKTDIIEFLLFCNECALDSSFFECGLESNLPIKI